MGDAVGESNLLEGGKEVRVRYGARSADCGQVAWRWRLRAEGCWSGGEERLWVAVGWKGSTGLASLARQGKARGVRGTPATQSRYGLGLGMRLGTTRHLSERIEGPYRPAIGGPERPKKGEDGVRDRLVAPTE